MLAATFTLNGAPLHLEVREDESLLETLRERLGLTSPKDGCRPQGECGACMVLLNGHPRISCTLPTARVEGDVLTLEGLSPAERSELARAFASAAAGQCGYCLPGIALHAHAFVAKHPTPTTAEIAKGLDMHLCRCGGYDRLVEAIATLARARSGEASPPALREGGVGAPVVPREQEALVLGTRPFVGDLKRPGQLFGALLLSPHPRAKVLAIDVAAALALPGVVCVATARDVPGERFQGLLVADQPLFVAEGEEVSSVGDVLAAVAAEDLATAREAARRVAVTYEVLPPVLTPEESLAEGAPRISSRHENLLGRTVVVRGDAGAALASSAHRVRLTFTTQRIEHLFLETEAALAEPDGDGLAVFSHGQGIFDDRRQIASLLGLPEERIHVTLVPAGGAFGGKEDLSVQGHAALLAWLTGRPVRVTLSREESVCLHPKRHPLTMDYEVGCDAEGHLTAVRAQLIGDSGAHASVGAKVLERAAGHAAGAYYVPNVAVEALAAYTNHPPSGAMRGFGVPQVTFALEACVDELAARVGLDPWQMRVLNVVRSGQPLTTGQLAEHAEGLLETLHAVKPAYDAARAAGRTVGIATGLKNCGLGNGAIEWGKARLVVEGDGTVTLFVGYTEMGQGLFTTLSQIASEVSGLPLSLFRARLDTTYALACGQTTGSRGTLHGGRAVRAAAEKLRVALAQAPLSALVGQVFGADLELAETEAVGTGPHPKLHTTYGFATQLCVLDAAGRVEKMVAAHDVGRAVNPSLVRAQITGSVVMGLGYALSEELVCEGGKVVSSYVRDLGALRARDVPPIEVLLVEQPEPQGPFGARGVGEVGLVPTAAAVANALALFEGVRRTRLPMKDSPAGKALHVGHVHVHAPHVLHALHARHAAPSRDGSAR
jgi:aldehyde oxidoreductase